MWKRLLYFSLIVSFCNLAVAQEATPPRSHSNKIVVQCYGNMGLASAGFAHSLSGRLGSSDISLSAGFVPKYRGDHTRLTYTVKFDYHPRWQPVPRLSLYSGLYITGITGDDYWISQPSRYPKRYYEWLSTRYRINVCLGVEARMKDFTRWKEARHWATFFETSLCDIYLRALLISHKLTLSDVVALSFGVRYQFD